MRPQEAKEKYCPIRIHHGENHCLAEHCMWWRWATVKGLRTQEKSTVSGNCAMNEIVHLYLKEYSEGGE